MLNRPDAYQDAVRARDEAAAGSGQEFLDLDQVFAACRRQWHVAVIATLVLTALGAAFVFLATPLYTASTDILIDHNGDRATSDLTLLGDAIESEVSVLSQVEIIKSEKVAQAVIDRLDLLHDDRFMAPDKGPIAMLRASVGQAIRQIIGKSQDDGQDDARRAAIDTMRENLGVARVGQTYVLEVSYTSPFPQLSAEVADAYAAAYLDDQLQSKLAVNRKAGDWLQGRIDELRSKLLASDLAVQKFSEENGLISTGGALVSDQQLGELNTLLVEAQADTAKSQARYDRIQAIIAPGHPDAIVTDALDSAVISGLRKSYMDASKRESEISQTLGPNHDSAVRLRSEMAQYKRLMSEELGRISESYRSDLEMAQSREQALRARVDSATGISKLASTAQVQLRELQREADTYRSLYEKVLQNYQEKTQLQSFPVTEARIISQALLPDKPSLPRKGLVIALAAVIGATLGTAIGAARELGDGTLRSGDDVRDRLGLDFLGYVEGSTEADGAHMPQRRREVLRTARVAIDHAPGGSKPHVAGVVSTLHGEGKSALSLDLARVIARQGARTLLIDADIRARSLSAKLAPAATAGLNDLIAGGASLSSAVMMLERGLAFLPVSSGQKLAGLDETLSVPRISAVISAAGSDFDYVIVDLPPMMPAAELRAIAPAVDSVLLVAAWGRTTRKAIERALLAEPAVDEKCAGVILTGVDRKRLSLYERPATRAATLAFRRGELREFDPRG